MASFTDIADGQTADAADVQQIIDVLKGTAGNGNIPVSITAVNDATNFALTVRNQDTTNGRVFRAQDSSGTTRLQLTSSGVEADAEGGGTLSLVVTRTATETLTNKTLSSGTKITLGSDATGDLWYRNSSGEFTRLGIGSSGEGLESTGGVPVWRPKTAAGFDITIPAGAFEFSTASFPQPDKFTSTNFVGRVLRFDPSSAEDAWFNFGIPTGTPLNSITAYISWHSTNTSSGKAVWSIAHLSRAAGEQIDTAFASTDSTHGTHGSTANELLVTSLVLSSIGGYAAGEDMQLRLQRSASNSSDTLATDALLRSLRLEFR